jgi:hypothetical protein
MKHGDFSLPNYFFMVIFHRFFLCFPGRVSPHPPRGLAEEIGGHAADIEAASKEKQNATELRETTRSDFVATLKDPDLRDLPMVVLWENHRKTIGKWWLYPLVN